MVAKNPVRYLAPVAIIAVAIAVGILVSHQLGSHHAAAVASTVRHQLPVSKDVAPKHAFYVVKPGDTLSSISVKTGVTIARLEALNPSIQDPNALQTGVRLRLRR